MSEFVYKCSFCGKSEKEAKKLIASPGGEAYICDECVHICKDIIAENISDDADIRRRLRNLFTVLGVVSTTAADKDADGWHTGKFELSKTIKCGFCIFRRASISCIFCFTIHRTPCGVCVSETCLNTLSDRISSGNLSQ